MVLEDCSHERQVGSLPFGACEQSPLVEEAAGGLAVVTAGGSPAQVANRTVGEVG